MAINQGKDEEIQKIARIVRENMEEKGAYSCEQGVFYSFVPLSQKNTAKRGGKQPYPVYFVCQRGGGSAKEKELYPEIWQK